MGCGGSTAANTQTGAGDKDATKAKGKPKTPVPRDYPEDGLFTRHDIYARSTLKDVHKVGSVWDSYRSIRDIGEGGFGKVSISERRSDGYKVAIKVQYIDRKKDIDEEAEQALEVFDREIKILRSVHHPHICYFHESFIDRDPKKNDKLELCMVLELCQGPELFDAVVDHGNYSESDAAGFFKTILTAVAHLHKNNVVHLDIKPENFVFSHKFKPNKEYPQGEEPTLKLIDFGVASEVKTDELFSIKFLSLLYSPPEVLNNLKAEHTLEGLKANDMWAIGCVLYILLTASRPFSGDTRVEMCEDINLGLAFPDDVPLSDDAKDLLCGLLCPDYKMRLTAEDAFDHPFMKRKHDTVKPLLPVEIAKGLSVLGRQTKLKRAIAEYALKMRKADQEIFKKEFFKADKDGDGKMDEREMAVFLQQQKLATGNGIGSTIESDLKAEAAKIMKIGDDDSSGAMDMHEFQAMLELAELSNDDELLEAVFRSLDKDNSGTVSVEEMKNAFEAMKIGEILVSDVLEMMDKNPNQMAMDEFKNAMKGGKVTVRPKTKHTSTS